MESDPSVVEESDVGFTESLAASDKAGQDTAPITGLTSATSLGGIFQAGFFGAPALFALSASELSESADKEEVEEDDEGSDWWWSGSESAPRTTWAQGEGRFFRGLLLAAAVVVLGEEESAAITIADLLIRVCGE